MNADERQVLSLLVDGECSGVELSRAIETLLSDPQLKQAWERYHLAGQVLRRESVHWAVHGLAARMHGSAVWTAGAGQAPRVGGATPPRNLNRWFQRNQDANRTALPLRAKPRRRPTYAAVPLVTALAAGLAVVAVFLVSNETETGVPSAKSADTAPYASAFDQRWQRKDPLLRAKLDQLMIDHQQHAPGSGLVGVASYAAVVGYEGRP